MKLSVGPPGRLQCLFSLKHYKISIDMRQILSLFFGLADNEPSSPATSDFHGLPLSWAINWWQNVEASFKKWNPPNKIVRLQNRIKLRHFSCGVISHLWTQKWQIARNKMMMVQESRLLADKYRCPSPTSSSLAARGLLESVFNSWFINKWWQ